MSHYPPEELQLLAGRCRMGDRKAAAECREILTMASRAPVGSREREAGRYLAYCLKNKMGRREAFLPQGDYKPKTKLGRRLRDIFVAAGGQVHLRGGERG